MISGFDHVAITTSDLEASCSFYCTVLGGEIEAEYRRDGVITVCRVRVGGALLNIHQQGNGIELVARRPTPGAADLCFRWAASIEAALDHLNSLGVSVIAGPEPRVASDGRPARSLYFRDCDGNLLELLAPDD